MSTEDTRRRESGGPVSVLAVFGPTASGKSAVAEALADRLRTEIVSADALQVYRGLPILTNQPLRPTRLVAIRALDHAMSVGEYAGLAHAAIDEIVGRSGVAIVAGGTGLYMRAALGELHLPPAPTAGARARWEAAYDADPCAAHARLRQMDETAAEMVHPHDRRRVVRALELAETGSSLVPPDDRLWAAQTRRPTLIVGLEIPPDELERRIIARTDAMFGAGVVEEVHRARASQVSRTAEKALGLQEIAALAPDAARERIILRTRRYAAYQRKWMRRIPGIVIVDGGRDPAVVADEILELLQTAQDDRGAIV